MDGASSKSKIQAHAGEPATALRTMLLTKKWAPLLELGIVFSPVLFVIIAFRMIQIENPMWFVAAVWIANVIMLLLVAALIRLRGETWESRPKASHVGWAVLKSIPIFVFAVVAFILGAIVMANIVGVPDGSEGADMSKYNYLQGNLLMLVVSLFGSYLVASFGEEVVYRGFLITRLERLFGKWQKYSLTAAILLSSIVFGFAHFEWGAFGVVQTAFMGAALAVSFVLLKRRLWPLILAHGYMDTILMFQLFFAPDVAS